MKYWIPHIIFAIVAAATLTAIFLCINPRYDKEEELVERFIKENNLEQEIAEGWWPDNLEYYRKGDVLVTLSQEYGERAVDFFLHELESENDTRIAVALRELQFAVVNARDWPPRIHVPRNFWTETGNRDYKHPRVCEAMAAAEEKILSRQDEIASLIASKNPVVREGAMTILVSIAESSAALRLKNIADSDHPAQVRVAAIEGLSDIKTAWLLWPSHGHEARVDELEEWLAGYARDKEPVVRVAALYSLNADKNQQLITDAQRDNDIRVRLAAALKLLVWNKKYDRELLVYGMNSPFIDKKMRLDIAVSLARRGKDQPLRVLIELIGDSEALRDVKGWYSHYDRISFAIAHITGTYCGPPRRCRGQRSEKYEQTVKAFVDEWLEKHKDEVLKRRK